MSDDSEHLKLVSEQRDTWRTKALELEAEVERLKVAFELEKRTHEQTWLRKRDLVGELGAARGRIAVLQREYEVVKAPFEYALTERDERIAELEREIEEWKMGQAAHRINQLEGALRFLDTDAAGLMPDVRNKVRAALFPRVTAADFEAVEQIAQRTREGNAWLDSARAALKGEAE